MLNSDIPNRRQETRQRLLYLEVGVRLVSCHSGIEFRQRGPNFKQRLPWSQSPFAEVIGNRADFANGVRIVAFARHQHVSDRELFRLVQDSLLELWGGDILFPGISSRSWYTARTREEEAF